MAKLRINGDTSGYVDITVPAVAGNTTMNIASPTFSGNITVPDTVILNSPSAPTGNRQTRIGNYSDGNFVIARHNDDGSYKGNALVSWTDGAMSLCTSNNGNERIRINPAGQIQMSNQPYARVYYQNATNFNISSGQTIVFNNAPTNTGSCYNTSTGRFTAPVSGRYVVTSSIQLGVPDGNWVYNMGIYVNGINMVGTYSGTPSKSYWVGQVTGVVPCNSNDYIEIKVLTNTTVALESNTGDARNSASFMLLG